MQVQAVMKGENLGTLFTHDLCERLATDVPHDLRRERRPRVEQEGNQSIFGSSLTGRLMSVPREGERSPSEGGGFREDEQLWRG